VSKRILLISASIGGGHVAAARALESAFLATGATVKHIDLLDYTSAPFRRFYSQAYFDLVRTAPEFVDWLGNRLDRHPSERQSRQRKLRARATRLISYHLPRLINRYEPDVIVHTHFLAPEILSTRLMPNLLTLNRTEPIPQYVVITDFFAHSLWLQPNIDKYFVASEEVAVHLRHLGVDEARVQVTGIPIDPRFSKLEPKAVAKAKLGLNENKDLLLFMASGLDMKTIKPLLSDLRTLRWPLHVIIVCGRSQELKAEIEALVDMNHDLLSFEILGFSSDIPELMAAADLMVGKPGGLTSSEVLAAHLCLAIVQPYPLQEEANTSFLLENGVAFRIEPLTVFAYKLKRFFENNSMRSSMELKAANLAKANAAELIANTVLS